MCSSDLLRAGLGARVPYVVGVGGLIALAAIPRPEGDYLIASNLGGYALLTWAMALVVGGIVSSVPRRRTADPQAPPGTLVPHDAAGPGAAAPEPPSGGTPR